MKRSREGVAVADKPEATSTSTSKLNFSPPTPQVPLPLNKRRAQQQVPSINVAPDLSPQGGSDVQSPRVLASPGVSNDETIASIKDGLLFKPLQSDPEVYGLIEAEKDRQKHWLNLVASENYCSEAVLEAESSVMINKYSEGYPGHRHYGGNEIIDRMELLCQSRALDLFKLDQSQWRVNVQSMAGTQANHQVFYALLKPHERMMGLSLTHGGHMSFGYQTDKLKVSAVSTMYDTLPFRVHPETGLVDYDDLEKLAERFRPRLIIAGASSYCREFDYVRLREICNKYNSYLVVDFAHCAGLVVAGLLRSPFEYADVVTTATQKTLRGPRAAMIFCRKEYEAAINFAVFPSLQGGPHNHTIAALTVALGQAATQEFRDYQHQLLKNAKALEQALTKRGYNLVSGGTDMHMVVVSLIDKLVDGSRVNAACERAQVAISATAVPGDKWLLPRAIRLGTAAMTTRGFLEQDFEKVAEIIDQIIQLSKTIQRALPDSANKLRDFKAALSARPEFDVIKQRIANWTGSLPLPGN